MYLEGERGHDKNEETAKKYYELLKGTHPEMYRSAARLFNPPPAPTPFGGNLRGAFNNNNASSNNMILFSCFP